MKKPWIAAILNFFTLGLGTMYVGKRTLFGTLMLVGAVLAAFVEFSLKVSDPNLYRYSFISFLVLALATAWDGYREAQEK